MDILRIQAQKDFDEVFKLTEADKERIKKVCKDCWSLEHTTEECKSLRKQTLEEELKKEDESFDEADNESADYFDDRGQSEEELESLETNKETEVEKKSSNTLLAKRKPLSDIQSLFGLMSEAQGVKKRMKKMDGEL